jgi:hypothetical protein
MAEKHGKVKKMLIHNVELKGEEKELVEKPLKRVMQKWLPRLETLSLR